MRPGWNTGGAAGGVAAPPVTHINQDPIRKTHYDEIKPQQSCYDPGPGFL